ncbi:Serine/threonine-protein kinase AFC3 [Chlorella vulgaris]
MQLANRTQLMPTGCLNRSVLGPSLPQRSHRSQLVSLKEQRARPRSIPLDRDHVSPGWGDPHLTSPPHLATDTFSSSDLEFGADALSGGTLETSTQLKRDRKAEGLQHQGLGSEVHQGQTHVSLDADESTAAERQERYQGILQAMDSLQGQPPGTALPRGGASDDEGRLQPSPAAVQLATGGQGMDAEQRRFEELRRSVAKLGVGDEAADLIRQSYEGRDLRAEAHATIDPADGMPRPGNRYLPPHAVPPRKPVAAAMAARLGDAHNRPHLKQRHGLPSLAAPGGSSCSGKETLVTGAAVAPFSAPQPGQDGSSQEIDVELEAMRGTDAMYYSAEHASSPAAVERVGGSGGGSGRNTATPDEYDMEGDALRGTDAMFYFSTPVTGSRSGGREATQRGAVWAALNGSKEEAQQGGRTPSEAPDKAAKGSGGKQGDNGKQGDTGRAAHGGNAAAAQAGSVQGQQELPQQRLGSLAKSREKRGSGSLEPQSSPLPGSLREAHPEAQMGGKGRAGGHGVASREAVRQQPRGPGMGLLGVAEAAAGRAAAVGLASAVFTELLTRQSVLSQLLGRWEGPRQVEFALPTCQALAAAVLIGAAVLSVTERLSGSGISPRWNPLRLPPLVQLWTGRAAMLLFAFLLAYETRSQSSAQSNAIKRRDLPVAGAAPTLPPPGEVPASHCPNRMASFAGGGAFVEYLGGPGRLETTTLPATASTSSPLLSLTRGLGTTIPRKHAAAAGCAGPPPPTDVAHLTLPDGRLNVGTHLPLLAKRYRYLSTLGEGISAQVLLAEDTLAATPGRLASVVAIKVMKRQYTVAGQREARALRFLHAAGPGGVAPGLVRLLDTFMLGAHYCLVTERLFPWLLDWIAESSALPPLNALAQLRKMAHQLLVAVAFMHNQGLVNADIKPDNLLLCSPPGSGSVALRLADFGGCFSLTETDTQSVGCEVQTLPYRAPELPYGAAIDLWSVGVVLAEMALKRALLPCATPRDLLQQMAALLGPLPVSMVRDSELGQQLAQAAGRASRAGTAAAGGATGGTGAAVPAAKLPEGLQDRLDSAAAGLQLAVPHAGCQLYAELAGVDAQLANLVIGLLQYDPARRLTAHQALLHPFFDALCPMRAVFPQLEEQCSRQQAALQSQAATAIAASRPNSPAPARPKQQQQQQKEVPQQQQQQQQRTQDAVALAAAAEAEADEAVALALPAPARKLQPRQQQQEQNEWPVQQQRQSRFPAAQLLARRSEEQQQFIAAADPYAGSFSLEVTPPKDGQYQEQYQEQQQQGQQGAQLPSWYSVAQQPSERQQQQDLQPQQHKQQQQPAGKAAEQAGRDGLAAQAGSAAKKAAAKRTVRAGNPGSGSGGRSTKQQRAGMAAGTSAGKQARPQQQRLRQLGPGPEAQQEAGQASSLDLLLEAAGADNGWGWSGARPGLAFKPARKRKHADGGERGGKPKAEAAQHGSVQIALDSTALKEAQHRKKPRPRQQQPSVAGSSGAGAVTIAKIPGRVCAAVKQPAEGAAEGATHTAPPVATGRKQHAAAGGGDATVVGAASVLPSAVSVPAKTKRKASAAGHEAASPTGAGSDAAGRAAGAAPLQPNTATKRARRLDHAGAGDKAIVGLYEGRTGLRGCAASAPSGDGAYHAAKFFRSRKGRDAEYLDADATCGDSSSDESSSVQSEVSRQQLEADVVAAQQDSAHLRGQMAALLGQQEEERQAAAAASAALQAQAEQQRCRADAGEAAAARAQAAAELAAEGRLQAEAHLAAEERRAARLQRQLAGAQAVIANLADSRGDAFEERFALRQELQQTRDECEQAQRAGANLREALQQAQQREGGKLSVEAAREEGSREATSRWLSRVRELRRQLADARRKLQEAQEQAAAAQETVAAQGKMLEQAHAELAKDHTVLQAAHTSMAAELTMLRRRPGQQRAPQQQCASQQQHQDTAAAEAFRSGGSPGPASPSPCSESRARGR